jgi:hypothetical protein
MSQVIEVFDGHKDGWGMAFWFLSANSFGNDRRTYLLDPERVIAAARDEVQGIEHG